MRRTASVVVLAALMATAPSAASQEVEPPVAELRPGAVAFWSSADRLEQLSSTSCTESCQDFLLDVTGAAARLRVAADGDGSNAPGVELYDDSGTLVASQRGIYSAEALLDAPERGRYVVRVTHRQPQAEFRLRAKLERTLPTRPKGGRALLPNLQLVPPYEFTMEAPTAGQDLGCNAYEQAEYGARRCLRFSLGPSNVGDGPLMLEFPAMSGLVAPEPVIQLVQHADGTVSRREAGSALYHKTHAHHHHNGFGSLELLRVTDPRRGTMVLAGRGPKQGFCMLDFLIADWTSFANDPAGSVRQDCAPASGPTATQIGLGRGWADIYVYALDGNYVEFGDNPDGRYVVRSVADAGDDVLETVETDNTGYAYVEVTGSAVRVLERGHGTSPWDRRKRLADDLLPPNA